MKLTPGHVATILSRKTGVCIEISIKENPKNPGSTIISVSCQDLESDIEVSSEEISLEANGQTLIGRLEENE